MVAPQFCLGDTSPRRGVVLFSIYCYMAAIVLLVHSAAGQRSFRGPFPFRGSPSLPPGASCSRIFGGPSINAFCVSKVCIQGICQRGPASIGETCDANDDSDCTNQACGRQQFLAGSPYICCPTNSTVRSNNQYWCDGQPNGAPCLTASGNSRNAVCASNLCIDGVCQEEEESIAPEIMPTDSPSVDPSATAVPSTAPIQGTDMTVQPSTQVPTAPTDTPSPTALAGTIQPSLRPQDDPTAEPTVTPTTNPSMSPSLSSPLPSSMPSGSGVTGLGQGQPCNSNKECLNGACGKKNLTTDSSFICCPSNFTTIVNGEQLCGNQLVGAPCDGIPSMGESSNSICESNICIRNVCRAAPAGQGEACDANDNDDCANSACGRAKFVLFSSYVCCPSNSTIITSIGGDNFCTGQLDGASCSSLDTGESLDAACASIYCVDGICQQNNPVRDYIFSIARFGGSEFDDPSSYQSRALGWVLLQNFDKSGAPLQDVTTARIAQAYALACIFENTYATRNDWTDFHFGADNPVPGWFSTRGWLESILTVCEWYGITCDDQGLVMSIELDTNGLTGYFPPETALLAGSLRKLDLFNNILHNKGDLGNSWLGEMTNLEYLYYGTTSFEYDGVPTEIGLLTNLQEYDCSYTLYFGPLEGETWTKLSNLNYLVLVGNAYSSSLPQELVSLPNLQYLYASFCLLEGDLEFVSQMPSIFELWVDDNPDLSGTIPASFAGSSNLVSFSATGCGLSGTLPTELGEMTQMIQIWLSDNMLEGTIPTELGGMVRLKTLSLEVNDLSGEMPLELCNRRSPFGRLENLEADCDSEILCDELCCTCCGSACL